MSPPGAVSRLCGAGWPGRRPARLEGVRLGGVLGVSKMVGLGNGCGLICGEDVGLVCMVVGHLEEFCWGWVVVLFLAKACWGWVVG